MKLMKQNLLQSIFTAHEKSASIARKLGLLSILVIAATLLGSNVFAQTYTKITNVSGTTSYGAVSVTTTTSGYSNSPFCGGQADPFRSSGSFDVITFTFSSPISSIQLACQFGGGSGTSFFSYSVNGSPYSLSPAELIGAPSDGCYGGLLSVSGGVLTNSGNNAQLGGLVQINGTINSISITHNGNSASWLGAFFAPLVLNFDNGTTQNTKVCQNASATSINSLLTATGTFGTTFTWSVVSGPSHGALGGFPATASVGTSVSPTGTTYTPTTGYSGPDAYTIQVSDGTNTTNTTINVNVQAPPASITGNAIICGTGNTTTLSDAVTGGTWTSGTTAVATVGTSSGVVTSVATGTTIITYSTGCGSDVTQTVTVGAFPAAISGTATACPGTTATLTDATAFGAWSSSTSSVATVGSSTGIVTGVAAGTTTITYTLNTGCAVNKTFTVNATPAAITGGGGLLCVTNTMTLSDATSGGAWSSSNTAVATVSGGTVTGVSGGTTTITYTSASGCISTLAVSVTALPTVSGGSNVAICAGTGTTLTGSGAVLYTWSPATGLSSTAGTSVTASPTVTTTYTVTGSNATSATVPFSYTGSIVSYTVPAGVTSITIAASGAQGGSQTTTSAPGGAGANMSGVFSVTPGDVLKVLTGEQPAAVQHTGGGGGGSFVWNVTTGNTLLIAAGGGGGAGYDGNTNNGVNGINAVTTNNGTDGGGFAGGGGVSGNGGTTPSAFYYAAGGTGWFSAGAGGYGGGCSNSTGGSTPLTGGAGGVYGGTAGVNGNGGFGGGGGGQGICSWVGGGGGGGYSGGAGGDFPSNLAYPGGGGGSYNAGTSQSNSVGNTGNGIVTISYAIPGCQNTATVTVTVNPLPSAISGASSVCKSSTTTLTDATAFGAWSSSNTAVATIGSATGVASGVATGSTTITYT
ncbi:MAG: surface protein [Flavipsychrobacter sp.]|nr:surface protein [Flavipsychrobacter sp.]